MLDQPQDDWYSSLPYATAGAAKAAPATAPSPTTPSASNAQRGPISLSAPATLIKGQQAQAANMKVQAARAMIKQMGHVNGLYDQDMGGKGLAGLTEYNPFRSENQRFDGALAIVPSLARQAFRVAGSGSDTEGELKVILDTLPSRWSTDVKNAEKFKGLDSVLRGFIANYGGIAGYSPEQIAAMTRENVYAPKKRGLPKPPPSGARRVQPSRVVVDISGKRVR